MKIENKNKKIAVIYHRNCPDGFGAAWAAWRKFKDKAIYLAVEHQTNLPDIRAEEVYFLDFFPSDRAKIQEFKKKNGRIVALDHHISQKDLLECADQSVFSLKHSGAVLAWKYFQPKKPVPQLLRYIEDGDLWLFRLPKSRELLSALDTFNFDFDLWNKLARDFESGRQRKKYAEMGKAIEAYKEKTIQKIVLAAEKVEFAGHRILAANSPSLVSEIGHALALKTDDFAIVWRYRNGRLEVSLRSAGKTDVAKIAAEKGGGGHKSASGFVIPVNGNKIVFPWKKIS
jgi:oligoribonuclease NrnB/cAMP/cGMP phosphodiesterase (DHH superfamily)